ncbi:hypothetical protein ACIBG8_43385 [Nonomuraea sp. NPDC050556]|uniref:hypothetical protein n=1 Tax=Nonomuraea sp. NPDC050556 TaxID=3364369 RepID=UPI0037965081
MIVPLISVVLMMSEKRGIVMGVVAAVVWGPLLLPSGMVERWERRNHPVRSVLLFVPAAFCALALFTQWSLVACLGLALACPILLIPVAQAVTRRRGRKEVLSPRQE